MGVLFDRQFVDFIYSPGGFLAVWDAVEKHGLYIDCSYPAVEDQHFGSIARLPKGKWDCYGKDRYEAFYNAVFEAFKE